MVLALPISRTSFNRLKLKKSNQLIDVTTRVLKLLWVDPLLKIVQERGKTEILDFMYI